MVAAGEWRDYALDFLEEVAVFSIFRRTSEMPLFRVEKRPKLRAKQGQYCVIAAGGLVLKRGHDLGPGAQSLRQEIVEGAGRLNKRKSPVSPPGFSDLNLAVGLAAIAHEAQQEQEEVDEVEIEAQRAHDRLLARHLAVVAGDNRCS